MYRRGTPPDATYTFKHALVQDAAYDSLLRSKRAQLHAQIAQVLERDFAERVANEPELLAHLKSIGLQGIRRVYMHEPLTSVLAVFIIQFARGTPQNPLIEPEDLPGKRHSQGAQKENAATDPRQLTRVFVSPKQERLD